MTGTSCLFSGSFTVFSEQKPAVGTARARSRSQLSRAAGEDDSGPFPPTFGPAHAASRTEQAQWLRRCQAGGHSTSPWSRFATLGRGGLRADGAWEQLIGQEGAHASLAHSRRAMGCSRGASSPPSQSPRRRAASPAVHGQESFLCALAVLSRACGLPRACGREQPYSLQQRNPFLDHVPVFVTIPPERAGKRSGRKPTSGPCPAPGGASGPSLKQHVFLCEVLLPPNFPPPLGDLPRL